MNTYLFLSVEEITAIIAHTMLQYGAAGGLKEAKDAVERFTDPILLSRGFNPLFGTYSEDFAHLFGINKIELIKAVRVMVGEITTSVGKSLVDKLRTFQR